MLVLKEAEVRSIVDQLDCELLTDILQSALVEYSNPDGHHVCPERMMVTNSHFTSLHMPSSLNDQVAEKVVCVPRSGSGGLPASILVLDAESGTLRCIMNAAILTAVRTATVSLLATKVMLSCWQTWRPERICVFGTGEQAYQHARLHLEAITSLQVLTIITRSRNAQYEDTMRRLNIDIAALRPARAVRISGVVEDGLEDSVAEADIICCCTPSLQPLFSYELLKRCSNRQHLNLIGSYKPCMREVDSSTVLEADILLLDSLEDCRREAGEIIDAETQVGERLWQKTHELGRILKSPDSARKCLGTSSILSIFKCVGISVMDNAIGQIILRKAVEMNIGTVIDDY